jgi:hypothetical protein
VYDWVRFIQDEEDIELSDLLNNAIMDFTNNYKFKREFKRMEV